MKVMKLSTGSSFATKTTLVDGLKQSSSALACPRKPTSPVSMVCLMLPLKSNTLTVLFVVMVVPEQGGEWIGASPTQISFPMITSPFGPDWPTATNGGVVEAGQLPANCPTASSV